MALDHIIGVDHVVIPVRNLDAAAKHWQAAGFMVSPRGKHSDYMGTANHTIVLGDDYLELMGIDHPTPHNQATVEFLKEREGIERAAFTTDDAAALVAELKQRGIAAEGPLAFGRPVALPGGGTREARFQIALWPADARPGGLAIFACQHETRDAVWIPELQHHANGATGLVRLEIVAEQPREAAEDMARLIDRPVESIADGFRVPSGEGRAAFEFCTAEAFAGRYPESVRSGAAANGPVALVLESGDLAAAQRITGAIPHGALVSLPAAQMTGVIVSFIAG